MAEQGLLLEALTLPTRSLGGGSGNCWPRGRADVVILQRKLLPRWQLALLRRAARRLIYDFDDAVFQRDSFSPKGSRSADAAGPLSHHVRVADAVIAGNDYLAPVCGRLHDPGRVHVVPTCVEPAVVSAGRPPADRSGRPAGVDRPAEHVALAGLCRRASGRGGRAAAGDRAAGDLRRGAARCRGAGGAPPLVLGHRGRRNWPTATSASVGSPTIPGAWASAA